MAIMVEDGTGLPDANSYVSVADAEEYATDRGLTFASASTLLKEAALIRATTAIDASYRSQFPGWKADGRGQALEWPRTDAYDRDLNLIPSNEVPIEVVQATIEAAVRELAVPGSTMPDLERGGAIKSVKAGSVAVEYADNAESGTVFSILGGIIAPVLTQSTGGLTGVTTRI